MRGIAGPGRGQTVRAETSRWLWEPSEESSPLCESAAACPSSAPGTDLPGRAPRGPGWAEGESLRALPCGGRSGMFLCPVLSRGFRGLALGKPQGLFTGCGGHGPWGDRLPGPHPWTGAGPLVLRLPGGGPHSPPGLGGPSGCPLVFAGTAGHVVVMAVGDRGMWAPRLALGLPRRPLRACESGRCGYLAGQACGRAGTGASGSSRRALVSGPTPHLFGEPPREPRPLPETDRAGQPALGWGHLAPGPRGELSQQACGAGSGGGGDRLRGCAGPA